MGKKDVVTAFAYGEGVVKVCGKIMLMRKNKGVLIAGLVFPDIISDENKEDLQAIGEKEEELWDVDMIIKPINKYVGFPEEDWATLSIDQKLGGAWARGWKRKLDRV